MSQQSSPHVSNHATTQNMSLNQHGTRPLSTSTQWPGQESRIGRVESPNSEHNAPHQWGNGVLPGNSPHTLVQHSSSGMMSPSQQPQWQNPAGTSYITQPSQQQQWGSENVPQNLQPHLSAQLPSANSQQRQASLWRNGAPAAGQPQSTTAQPANGAGQVLPNRSTQPSWNGYVESVGSQGSQQAQSRSWRSGIPPVSQQNTAAQHTGGAGLPIPIHPTQPSMSGESRSQSWSTPVTSASSPLNAQQQQDKELPSQLPTSFVTPDLNKFTQQSTHQRMVSIQQQTVRHSLRRQSIST
uniref:Pancreatic trypsin inhibitor n=1 Tax=Rhipicephalus zambeziensis TaxID=60191 RepID=A0A224YCS8_9ACAR